MNLAILARGENQLDVFVGVTDFEPEAKRGAPLMLAGSSQLNQPLATSDAIDGTVPNIKIAGSVARGACRARAHRRPCRAL